MNLQLEDKRALVTGSSSGLGEAIAKALAAEGAAVVVHGRDRERARRVAAEIVAADGRAVVATGDLASDEEAGRVAAEALAAFGGLDILVNNAGAFPVRGWWDTTAAQWVELYNQNVGGTVRLILALVPAMRERGWGRVIQIASGMGLSPGAMMPDYAATKAVNALTSMSLAEELAGSGVTVNTVSPGPFRTPGADVVLSGWVREGGLGASLEEAEPRLIETVFPTLTVRRLGRPEEVADAVAFLASPRASYINGSTLRVDGGYVKGF